MGKNLIQQARGKGGPRYRAPSFRYAGEVRYAPLSDAVVKGTVEDILHSAGHSSPLMGITYENGNRALLVAPEGIKVGDEITMGLGSELKVGNALPLRSIPEGASIYNIESMPGDGGKFVRASGVFAKVKAHLADGNVLVILPSKKQKTFNQNCRATVGIAAGGGRPEKPFLKAGKMFYKMRARNKLYPVVSGAKQNAVDHPFGNSRSLRKSKARPVSRHAPPGRKVGMIAAPRSGRKKK